MSVSLQFLGAAETVTGSKHLLTIDNRKFLIDCGLFQGLRELKDRNWQPFPINPQEIEAVLITHAHIDHIGYLPRLYTEGYRGPIYCTSATNEITRLSLPDSGHLQEEYARFANKHNISDHKPALPLYTAKDADDVCKLLENVKLDTMFDLGKGCQVRFRRAGHILGSAFIEFHMPDGRMVLFTGDLGRPNQPILRDPQIIEAADFLLIESTYGDRVHPKTAPTQFLKNAILKAIESRGMIIVPAFAIGRTQDLLYYLQELDDAEPSLMSGGFPIYIDSPMAVDATGIYARHPEDYDIDMEALVSENHNPLRPKNIQLIRKMEDSKKLNAERGPAMIISSSGMASGGRVVHHLAQRLPHPENIVLFVGYQAAGTLGRRLMEGEKRVGIMGMQVDVRAQVLSLESLSAHADSDEIIGWMKNFKVAPKRTFIVHGEPSGQAALLARIQSELGWEAMIPKLNETVSI